MRFKVYLTNGTECIINADTAKFQLDAIIFLMENKQGAFFNFNNICGFEEVKQ